MAAIEPISSMMTIQAQPVQKVTESSNGNASQTSTQKPADEFVSVGASEVPQVDPKTLSVRNVAESSEEGASEGQANSNEEFIEKTNERVKKAVSEINKNMDNSIAQFGIHEGTNRITIKIVDKQTKEVIKELPPEKTLDMIAKAWELAGLMVDERR
ncbi:MAG: flagellar protein FlaG [Lachnospiraceae bacterium]|nr:flagellar protein FlaG [Lachnospiraceae bacterium]